MNDARGFMQVLHCTQQLQEVVPGESFVETALFVLDLDKGEEIPLLHKLQHYEKDLDSFATGLNHYLTVAVVLYQLDYVGVVH